MTQTWLSKPKEGRLRFRPNILRGRAKCGNRGVGGVVEYTAGNCSRCEPDFRVVPVLAFFDINASYIAVRLEVGFLIIGLFVVLTAYMMAMGRELKEQNSLMI